MPNFIFCGLVEKLDLLVSLTGEPELKFLHPLSFKKRKKNV